MTDIATDREQVLRVHRQWWQANVGLDIESMRACFPVGDKFSMFNRNSFTYFGVDEVSALWQHFIDLEIPPRLEQTVAISRLEIQGDVAWLACELTYTRVAEVQEERHWEIREDASGTFGSKATEIYHRDDGAGNAAWRMWHFQSGPLQPNSEARPPFGDTLTERALGANPYGDPFVTTYQLSR